MFYHLTQTYTEDEAREILIQKYPEYEGDINLMVATTDVEEDNDLASAVRAKTSKSSRPPKTPKVSKLALAKELYDASDDKSRKAMISVYIKELGLNATVASSYFYKCSHP
jgi:hypothetical protein